MGFFFIAVLLSIDGKFYLGKFRLKTLALALKENMKEQKMSFNTKHFLNFFFLQNQRLVLICKIDFTNLLKYVLISITVTHKLNLNIKFPELQTQRVHQNSWVRHFWDSTTHRGLSPYPPTFQSGTTVDEQSHCSIKDWACLKIYDKSWTYAITSCSSETVGCPSKSWQFIVPSRNQKISMSFQILVKNFF